MKIALLTDGIYPYVMGGMQKHSFYTAKYLALNKVFVDLYHMLEEGQDPYLSCFSEEENKYIRSIVISFPKLDSLPGHYIRESYEYSVRIFNEFKKNNESVDFIYAQGFCGWEMIKQKSSGLHLPPIGVHFHGLEMFQKPANFRSRLEQVLLRKPTLFNLKNSDYTFSLGGKLSNILLHTGLRKEKIIEIPLGISKDWINAGIKENDAKKRVFVFVGRYERRKGLEELNKALESIKTKFDFEFNFIGPIPKNVQLRSEKINYLGSISDPEKVKSIIKKADVLLCPSHSEGMPNVIVEAMASGLAVIATDVGAISVLVSEKTGKLIERADPDLIEKAIVEFIQMGSAKLQRKKLNSKEHIENHFVWDRIMEQTILTISTIIK